MQMKLITGGSGVIGRALVQKLLKKGENVRVYDLAPPPIKHPNIEFFRGDTVVLFFSLTFYQVSSLIIILVGIFLFIHLRKCCSK